MRISKQDVHRALRSFTRQPRFTLVAVLSLSLAMALNTTMYSVLDAIVNPRYEMRAPDRLYDLIMWGDIRHRVDNATRSSLLRSGLHTYEAVSYGGPGTLGRAAVEHDRRFAQATVGLVAPNYFAMLGVRPIAGRVFTDADYKSGAEPVVISDRLAGTLFPERESPIGAPIEIDGVEHPVIGVLGRGSALPARDQDLWELPELGTLDKLPVNILRLRDDASLEQAEHELSVLSERFAMLAGERPSDPWFQLKPAIRQQFSIRGFHYALISSVLAVLLIACANLANLQLARGIGRARELAVRAALGASRADLVLQLFLESMFLSLAGLVLGLLLTFWGMHLLASRIPPAVSDYIIAPQASWRVFAFAAAVCIVCAVLIGLVPAIRVSRVDPNDLLKSGAGTGAHRRHRRQYGIMVVAQVALTLALLGATSLIVRTASYYRSMYTGLGYDIKPLSAALLLVQPPRDSAAVSLYRVSEQLLSRIRSVDGVADAAAWFSSGYSGNAITVADVDGSLREIPNPTRSYMKVSPSYLRTKGIAVDEGHDFSDGEAAEPEVIIDHPTARKLFPSSSAIGRHVKLGAIGSNRPWVRVVGVARSASESRASMRVNGTPPSSGYIGDVYYRLSSRDSTRVGPHRLAISLSVRALSDPARMPIVLRRALVSSPPFRLLYAQSEEEAVGFLRERQRHDFISGTFVSFSAVALALAVLGIYGIVAHAVAERRREIGVRLALGASSRDILRVVLREGNAIVLAGIAIGIVCVWKSEWWLRAFTFEDDKLDAPLFAIMSMLVFAVAFAAAVVPAMRATRIDPVESLRND